MKTLRLIGVMVLSVVATQPKDPKDWSGHKISEMVNAHGAPSLVYDDPELKLKVYVWNSQYVYSSGQVQTYNYGGGIKNQAVVGGGGVMNNYRMFWVDAVGSITKWKAGTSK